MRVTDPVALEALLRAEEAVGDVELEAGRALQGAGVAVAVCPEAALLCGWLCRLSHGWGRGELWLMSE